jgi:thiol:disulfide interchange protein DsbC
MLPSPTPRRVGSGLTSIIGDFMFKRILCGFLGIIALVLAPIARADEAGVKKGVEAWLGNAAKVDGVRKAGFLNLYEVRVGGDIVYTDEKVTYVLIGNVIDVKARRDLTEERKNKLAQIKFSDLPLDMAVKLVRGDGKRVIATFEDPNCGWCKKLAKELQGIDNLTVYTFLVPLVGGADSNEKNRAIWCAPDRGKAWMDFMLNGILPPEGKCDAPLEKMVALAKKLGVRGTPTIVFADGSRAPGFLPAAKLEQAMGGKAAPGNENVK